MPEAWPMRRPAAPSRPAPAAGTAPGPWLLRLLAALLLLLVLGVSRAALPVPVPLDAAGETDLFRHGRLYEADGSEPPAAVEQLDAWLARLKPAAVMHLLGGRYWLHAVVRNDTGATRWVLDPHASVIERIEAHVLQAGQPPQRFSSGYMAEEPQYLLHYGGDVALAPGAVAHVLLYMESGYYARQPRAAMLTQDAYRHVVLTENLLVLFSLGMQVTLALYNLFLFWGTRDRALLHYALFMLCSAVSWGLSFHLGAQGLQWFDLRWHYVGFFLLPVFNGLFCLRFLQLPRLSPRLARLTYFTIALSLALLPSAFLALPVANSLCTLLTLQALALTGIAGWRSVCAGFEPARYFLAGFLVLLVPAGILLLANLGFFDTPVRNPEVPTILGIGAYGLLLAFALADKVRLLARQKDEYLQRLDRALDQTRTDHLTGILNRHAFDQMLAQALAPERGEAKVQRTLLAMIDLDGLKAINDTQGHTQGDALLCAFAQLLRTLCDQRTAVFRLGGDEFAVLGHASDEARLCAALPVLERRLRAEGFPASGVSFGMAFGYEAQTAEALIQRADNRMYAHKAGKRANRLPAGATPRRRAADRSAVRDGG